MTPQELKNSILQLAIQGKLVEQRPEEGTAEEHFARIQQEKQRLIAEKKIKSEKPLPEITDDEKPFDIPESWKWVRFGTVISLVSGTDFKPEEYNDQGRGTVYITGASNLSENGVIISRWTETPRNFAYRGDILLVCKGSGYGKTVFCDVDEVHIARQIMAIKQMNSLNMSFTRYFLQANLIYLKAKGQGVIPGIDRASVLNVPFPLPPLAEQKRIVAKIEELLPYIDRYEQAWSKLEQFNSRFPEDMKKSLLQYAIQGKLVEQRPEEGTAEELFTQIQEEKQRLIAEKKIKKEKSLPEITEDEKPFDIPESWKWVRVGDIFAHNTGKAMNSTAKKVDKPGSVKRFIATSTLYWNSFDFSSVKEMFFSYDELERCTVTKGDLLMCEGGAYYGRTAIWNYDYDICFQNHVHRLRPYQAVELLFFYHLFHFYKSMNMMNAKGTAMPGLSSQTLHQMIVPLPPLSEQKRIVEKLEQLLPLCERLK